jgi:hypothetical protein
VLPQSDDAALRLQRYDAAGSHGQFQARWREVRVLEKRGRRDVIAALKRHEIGYHSNLHSGQLTPAVYLQHMGWEDGADEFHRREVDGVRDIERIFGVTPICYGQPGSSWAAQTYPALRKMGIRCTSTRVGMLESTISLFITVECSMSRGCAWNTLRLELGKSDNLATAQDKFAEVSRRLTASWRWDDQHLLSSVRIAQGVLGWGQFLRRGESPLLPSELKPPPMQTAEEIERNYRD